MIWRIGGYLTIAYIALQLILLLWQAIDPEMRANALRDIDWNVAPENLRFSLEYSRLRIPQILTLVATIPVIGAFFLRDRESKSAHWWFLSCLVGCVAGISLQFAVDYQIGNAGIINTAKETFEIHHFNWPEETLLMIFMSLPLWYYMAAELITSRRAKKCNGLQASRRNSAGIDEPPSDGLESSP